MEDKFAPAGNSIDHEDKSVRMPEGHSGQKDAEISKEFERLKADLIAHISQEFRTPLTSIKGFASSLLEPDIKWSDKERRDFLESIEQETDRLTHLIRSLLDMTQLETGILKLEKSDCQLSEIINALTSQLDTSTRHHPLHIKIAPNLPVINVDKDRIGQVIVYLVQNAVKYSKEGSPVTIEAKYLHDQVIIRVIDKGIGIPHQLRDKVFDRFCQVENIVSGRRSQGNFELSICKATIEAHGCKIWVESRVGEGSKFNFTLPVSSSN